MTIRRAEARLRIVPSPVIKKFLLPLFAMLLAGDQCGKIKIPQRRKVLAGGLHL